VFYFQKLLSQALSGIDGTNMIGTVTTIAYTILLIGFMVSLYQAAMRGGDVQSLGVAAIKYVVVAIILANWTTVFHDINSACNQLAQYIASTSSAGDMFSSWMTQLKQQFEQNTFSSLWKLIIGSPAALITVLLIIAAYLIFAVAVVVFGFFYTLYGCVLYVIGPVILALLPIVGIGGLGANFATNLFIWNSWGILYALFGCLITAIHLNDVNTIFSNGFAGFFVGTVDSLVLGIVSIFYAVAILLIPKIAKSIIAGDLGVTMSTLARAGAAAAATVMSVIAGASAGGAAAGGSSAGAGASSGAGTSAGTGATGGAASSSSPPPQPSLASTITSGIRSAVGGDAAPPSSNGSGNGASSGEGGSSASSTSTRSSSQQQPQPFHRGSLVQTAAFHTARVTRQLVDKTLSSENGSKGEGEDEQ
jgi:hypothetical protein